MKSWRCVKHCGACCHLEPADRPELENYLAPEELAQYLSLVGEGGWCVNFDRSKRECRIYDSRPRFCRVSAETFKQMYGIAAAEFDEFAIDCCRQQIAGVYGANSWEMQHYKCKASQ